MFKRGVLLIILSLLIVGGCGRSMMPTPAVFWSGEVDPWDEVLQEQQSPWADIFYATDRPAAGDADDRRYKNGRGPAVRLGEVRVRLGSSSSTWDDLVEASRAKTRSKKVPLVQGDARELGTLTATVGERAGVKDPSLLDPAGQQAFADAINRRLARSARKNINVYLHGANVAFYDSVVVAAEFFHFQGRDSVMLAYSWPTRQSPAFYGLDRGEAKKSIPNLTELLDFLAHNTDVDAINLLGYSAGGPLLAGALADLRERYPDLDEAALSRELKIKNVYFVASDAGLQEFFEDDLKTFHPLPQNILITVSRDDPILGMAGVLGGGVRLGAATAKGLSRQQLEELDELLPKIDVIDVSYFDPGREGGSFSGHGYWYQNTWVATDVLASFRWSIPAETRGLARVKDIETWYFPNDYPQRITDLVVRVRSGTYDPDP
jgi:esterase/lipase superfamily enzyme